MPELTLISWNVNGARAVHRAGFLDWLRQISPDIVCLQETRAEAPDVPDEMRRPPGYWTTWHGCRRKKGYSGTALFSRQEPLSVHCGLGYEQFDDEGRTIVADYGSFVLINCYFPNGGRDHSRVPFKLAFYDAFLDSCDRIRAAGKGVIFCGDVNTAHREIDLAHPRQNQKMTGFLPEERAWLDTVVAAGYVDTFRFVHPDLPGQYTWWSMVTRSRERNIGWRLDYVFVSPDLLERVTDAFILPEVYGSDHCPVGLRLAI